MDSPRPQSYAPWPRWEPSETKARGKEPGIAVEFPSSACALTRFTVTRGQPLDPAEGPRPSDSLVFKLVQAYGKMFRDPRLSSG